MMKTYYCPLCGEELKMYAPFPQESIALATCLICGYQILNDSALRYGSRTTDNLAPSDYQVVEAFLSNFPPIMRLRVGDKIKCYGKIGEVFYKDLNNNVIEVYFGGEYSRFVSPADIEKFPWELEEERKLK